MTNKTQYAMGFIFSEDLQNILLILKNRPDLLNGKWTGVGGHIEPGETPLQAVVREIEEESGLLVKEESWVGAGVCTDGKTYDIHIFSTIADPNLAQSLTEEPVQVHALNTLSNLPLGPRLEEYLERALRVITPAPAPRTARNSP